MLMQRNVHSRTLDFEPESLLVVFDLGIALRPLQSHSSRKREGDLT